MDFYKLSSYLIIFLLMGNSVDLWIFNNQEKWYTLEECRRTCTDNEPPRYCYYHFGIEFYHTMGSPCFPCRQNNSDRLVNMPRCQCIEADGMKRTIVSINRVFPGPSIQVCQNDILIIDVENRAEGLEISIHWHGQLLRGYQYFDGVPMVTQCPIPAGSKFRYQFPAKDAGTFFYHAHVATQRMDGQFGSLIVRQPPSRDPHFYLYDEDLPTHVIMLHDWLHYLSTEIAPGVYLNTTQPPNNFLINGRGRYQHPNGRLTNATLETFYVEPGKRYRFRLINALSLRCTALFTIERHDISVIEQDADPVFPETVSTLHCAGGERIDFILTANQRPGSYWIQMRGLMDCADAQIQQLAILSYTGSSSQPQSSPPTYRNSLPQGRLYNPIDGQCGSWTNAVCVNQLKGKFRLDQRLFTGEPDFGFILPLFVNTYENGVRIPYNSIGDAHKKNPYPTYPIPSVATIDGILFSPPSELLITSTSEPKNLCNRFENPINNCPDPCYCTHVLDVELDSVVELILYDRAGLTGTEHPFHLHGHKFTVLQIGPARDRNITIRDINVVLNEHRRILRTTGYSPNLPMKDTVIIPTAGYVILRFIANNPGWWIFHCHIDWHMVEGMNMIFHVGDPEDLPPVPREFPKCGTWPRGI